VFSVRYELHFHIVAYRPVAKRAIPCGGGVEYLHRSPASRRR
jgi:hypothetical protein